MLIIGIAGGTGSGKTTVVNQIVQELPEGEVTVISQDSYYRDNSHLSYDDRVKINFDHPKSIDFELLCKHLDQLRNGETIEQPVYSFVKHNRTKDKVITHPRKVVIVEGILILILRWWICQEKLNLGILALEKLHISFMLGIGCLNRIKFINL